VAKVLSPPTLRPAIHLQPSINNHDLAWPFSFRKGLELFHELQRLFGEGAAHLEPHQPHHATELTLRDPTRLFRPFFVKPVGHPVLHAIGLIIRVGEQIPWSLRLDRYEGNPDKISLGRICDENKSH
jgi:hypothetical protein